MAGMRFSRPCWLMTLAALAQNLLCDLSVRRGETDMVSGANRCPTNSYQQFGWCVCDFKYTLLRSVLQDEMACYSSSLPGNAGCTMSFASTGIRTVAAPAASLQLSTQGNQRCDPRRQPINVSSVLLWNYGTWQTWDDTWSKRLLERIAVVSQTPLSLKLTVLPQESWDGLLLSVKFSCGLETEECALLKFAGERKHPIPQSFELEDILKDISLTVTTKPTSAQTINRTTFSPVSTNWTQTTRRASALSSSPNSGGGAIHQTWVKIVLGVAGGVLLLLIILAVTAISVRARRLKKAEIEADHSGGFDRSSSAYESIGSQTGGSCSESNHYASVRIANPYSSVYHTPSKDGQHDPDQQRPATAENDQVNSEYHELEPVYIVPGDPAVWSRLPRYEYNNQAYRDDVHGQPLTTMQSEGLANELGQKQAAVPDKCETPTYCNGGSFQHKILEWNTAGSTRERDKGVAMASS